MQFLQRKKWFCRGVLALSAAALSFGASLSHGAQNLRLSTLGPGSAPYVVMTTFANIVNEHVPDYRIQVNATGAATRHAVETAQGRSEFCLNTPHQYDMMVKGVGPYANVPKSGELSKNLRSVFSFPIGVYHILTFGDSGIRSLDQIRGKRVYLGPPGSVAFDTTQRIVALMTGLKADQDYTAIKLGWDAAAQSFQDGHVDVYFNPTLAPSPVVAQLALVRKLRWIDIDPARLSELLARPGYRVVQIEPDVYGDGLANEAPVAALRMTASMGTNSALSEEAVYAMTSAFWKHLGTYAASSPVLRNVRLEEALADANTPLHPGAARFYREQGMTIPAELLVP